MTGFWTPISNFMRLSWMGSQKNYNRYGYYLCSMSEIQKEAAKQMLRQFVLVYGLREIFLNLATAIVGYIFQKHLLPQAKSRKLSQIADMKANEYCISWLGCDKSSWCCATAACTDAQQSRFMESNRAIIGSAKRLRKRLRIRAVAHSKLWIFEQGS